jgi:DNA invertase Pin-like site-specific DNA recombinase
MQDARCRAFDTVIVYKLDRWGRSLPHCIETIQELRSLGIRWIATTQNVDTDESNPMARLLLHLMAAFSEFERELIREPSMAGLKRYRDQYESGKVGRTITSRSGKNLPVGRPRRVLDRDRVRQLRSDGLSFRQIAFALGLGEGTVRRVLQTPTNASGAR